MRPAPCPGGAPGPADDLDADLAPSPELPNGASVNIQLPVGQTITAGHYYGSGYTGLVSMTTAFGCASNGAFETHGGPGRPGGDRRLGGHHRRSPSRRPVTAPGTDLPYSYVGPRRRRDPDDPHQGYYTYQSDGRISAFGNDNYLVYLGDLSASPLNQPIVGMATTPDGGGYWLVASDGGVFAYGDAGFYGSAGNIRLNRPIVGMAATADGRGYWLVASDGGVFAYGDATFQGSMGGITPQPTHRRHGRPSRGRLLAGGVGRGIFSFGGAPFHGSAGNCGLNKPVVGMAPTPDGKGYWLVASDGGIFSYGDAAFEGSIGSFPLAQPIVGMAPNRTAGGTGWWPTTGASSPSEAPTSTAVSAARA